MGRDVNGCTLIQEDESTVSDARIKKAHRILGKKPRPTNICVFFVDGQIKIINFLRKAIGEVITISNDNLG